MYLFLKSVLAVLASFFGVRSQKGFQADIGALKPLHILVAGFLCVLIFIGILLLLVQLAIK